MATADTSANGNKCIDGLDWCAGPDADDLPCYDCFRERCEHGRANCRHAPASDSPRACRRCAAPTVLRR